MKINDKGLICKEITDGSVTIIGEASLSEEEAVAILTSMPSREVHRLVFGSTGAGYEWKTLQIWAEREFGIECSESHKKDLSLYTFDIACEKLGLIQGDEENFHSHIEYAEGDNK
ncbi:hypothetical protein [Paenibacillus periandrae]|uniref:hypothetical protein n=1 Tax=Paenibacillus periandrae TaxID=1761741 RepID=UPI001F091B2D|nr:hypothetical protein [Paenibacillus periandrae]